MGSGKSGKKKDKKDHKKKDKKKAAKISVDEKRMLITMRAQHLWEKAGRPENADTHYWLEAEKEINSIMK